MDTTSLRFEVRPSSDETWVCSRIVYSGEKMHNLRNTFVPVNLHNTESTPQRRMRCRSIMDVELMRSIAPFRCRSLRTKSRSNGKSVVCHAFSKDSWRSGKFGWEGLEAPRRLTVAVNSVTRQSPDSPAHPKDNKNPDPKPTGSLFFTSAHHSANTTTCCSMQICTFVDIICVGVGWPDKSTSSLLLFGTFPCAPWFPNVQHLRKRRRVISLSNPNARTTGTKQGTSFSRSNGQVASRLEMSTESNCMRSSLLNMSRSKILPVPRTCVFHGANLVCKTKCCVKFRWHQKNVLCRSPVAATQ